MEDSSIELLTALKGLQGQVASSGVGLKDHQRGNSSFENYLRFGRFTSPPSISKSEGERPRLNCWEAIFVAAIRSISNRPEERLLRHYLLVKSLQTSDSVRVRVLQETLEPFLIKGGSVVIGRDEMEYFARGIGDITQPDLNIGHVAQGTVVFLRSLDFDGKVARIDHAFLLEAAKPEYWNFYRKTCSLLDDAIVKLPIFKILQNSIDLSNLLDGKGAGNRTWELAFHDFSIPALLRLCQHLDAQNQAAFTQFCKAHTNMTVAGPRPTQYALWLRQHEAEQEKSASARRAAILKAVPNSRGVLRYIQTAFMQKAEVAKRFAK